MTTPQVSMNNIENMFKITSKKFLDYTKTISGNDFKSLGLLLDAADAKSLMYKFNKNFMKHMKNIDVSIFQDIEDVKGKRESDFAPKMLEYNDYCIRNIHMFSVFGEEYLPLYQSIFENFKQQVKSSNKEEHCKNLYNFWKLCNCFVKLTNKYIGYYEKVNGIKPF